MPKILAIAPAPSPVGDIIFVHGLGGSPIETWGFQHNNSWKDWIEANRPDLNIWSIEYAVEPTEWRGNAMPLSDRALNILALLDNKKIGSRPIVFIGHSMGGLLIKEMLRHSLTITPRFKHIAESTKAVIFFATPHTGASLSDIATFFSFLVRPSVAVSELASQQPRLRELNLWFRNNYAALGLKTCIFYETQETLGVRVVNETSADPGIPLISPIPIDADHITITKPESYDDIAVGQTLQTIDEAIPSATYRYDPERRFQSLADSKPKRDSTRAPAKHFFWHSFPLRLSSKLIVGALLAAIFAATVFRLFGPAPKLATVTIDREMHIGHYIGLPRFYTRLTISNPSTARLQFTISNAILISPDNTKQFQMSVEAILNCNGSVPVTLVVTVEPTSSSVCIYSFITPHDYGLLAQSVNNEAAHKGGFAPGPRANLIEGPLLAELVATATDNFVWKPGEWQLRLDYSLSNSQQTKRLSFNVNETDVKQLRQLIQYYGQGYGVYLVWRDLTPDGTQPTREVITKDLST
jgi:hypothetical protein